MRALFAILLLLGIGTAAPDLCAESDSAPVSGAQTSTDHDAALQAFYRARAGAPLWINPAQDARGAAALVTALRDAGSHGLNPERFGASGLSDRLSAVLSGESGDAVDAAGLEIDLSRAFLHYAHVLARGATNPDDVDGGLHIDIGEPEPRAFLEMAAAAGDWPGFFERLAPVDPAYGRLRDELRRLTMLAKTGGFGPPVPGRILRPGDFQPEVTMLRTRLVGMGDLPPEPELLLLNAAAPAMQTTASFYDDRLTRAVARFQLRHGLEVDGVAGPATLRALNTPVERRIAQIIVNLERLRWRNFPKAATRIEVNQAGFELRYFEDNLLKLQSNVVVGQPERRLQTPEFDDRMSYLVFNPTWTVPYSIASREILPELQKNPEYLAENEMILLKNGAPVEDTGDIDWNAITEKTFPYMIRQKPGPGNALGQVKFMFPNRFSIYLHDTPARDLFSRPSRAFSHGCVRVERPLDLAAVILSRQSADPSALIREALASGEEKTIPLTQPIPVRLGYFTAWVDDAGLLHFRDDVYGRDTAVAEALRGYGAI